jgi:hypothetical protein
MPAKAKATKAGSRARKSQGSAGSNTPPLETADPSIGGWETRPTTGDRKADEATPRPVGTPGLQRRPRSKTS